MYKIDILDIQSFKFFKDIDPLKFEKKNILIYGENGSGKSTIYWALYTFFQSSIKNNDEDIIKYFTKATEANPNPSSLVNIYENDDKNSKIEVVLKDTEGLNPERTFTISQESINTNKNDLLIEKGCYAGDFITYKYIFRFFDFLHKEEINLFKLFEYDILHFISKDNYNLAKLWEEILKLKKDNPGPVKDKTEFADLTEKLKRFNGILFSEINKINKPSNIYLKKFGYTNIKLDLRVVDGMYTRKRKFIEPRINLSIIFVTDQGKDLPISRAQSYFNEAKLTAIALSVRFAITQIKLRDADVKILVLDDLLVSLDMSNREIVLNMLINDENFEEFQIIMLTHDKAFYEKSKRKFDFKKKNQWKYFEMYIEDTSSYERPYIKESIYYFEKARELFKDKQYSECANNLRKEAEELLIRFLPESESKKKGGGKLLLQGLIDKARSYVKNEKSYQKLDTILKKLEKYDHDDKHRDFYEAIKTINITRSFNERNKEKILNILYELEEFKSTILNPQSHHDIQAVLYKKEIEEGMALVRSFYDIIEERNAGEVVE